MSGLVNLYQAGFGRPWRLLGDQWLAAKPLILELEIHHAQIDANRVLGVLQSVFRDRD